MKNTFIKGIALLAITSLTLFSCSNENEQQTKSSAVNMNSSITNRESGEVYEEYKDLMSELYNDNQKVEETVEYRQDEETYLVSEVTLDGTLQGYFLENPTSKEVVYVSENKSNGTLDYYTSANGEVSKKVFDLTQDPNYATDGFFPKAPNLIGKRRFWGTETSNGAIAANNDGTPGCFYGVYETSYVFWIATGPPKLVDTVQIPCP